MPVPWHKYMNLRIFFRDLGDCFNPSKYHILIDDRFRQILKFFFCALFLFLVVASILFVPKLVILPFQAEKELAKFSEFSVDAKVKTTEPVNLGFITIDTKAEQIPDKKGLFITNDTMQVNLLPFGLGKNQAQLDDLKDLTRNRKTIKVNLLIGTILLLPYIFILLYVYSAVKYLLLALLVAAFIVVSTRTLKGVVKARVVLKVALYATPLLMFELILQVFTPEWYINTLLPFVLFLLFNIVVNVILSKEHRVRSHSSSKEKPKKKRERDYEEEEEETIDPDFFANTKFGKKQASQGQDSVDMKALKRDLDKNRIR